MMIHGRYSHEGQGDFKSLWEVVLKYWVLPLRMSAAKNRILWQYSICETTIASIVQDMHIVPNMCNYQYFRKIFHQLERDISQLVHHFLQILLDFYFMFLVLTYHIDIEILCSCPVSWVAGKTRCTEAFQKPLVQRDNKAPTFRTKESKLQNSSSKRFRSHEEMTLDDLPKKKVFTTPLKERNFGHLDSVTRLLQYRSESHALIQPRLQI